MDPVESQISVAGEQDTTSQDYPVSGRKGVPGLAKLVMMLQTGIIAFLAFWAYQEYVYNQYLQDYVSGFLQGGGLLVVMLGTVGILALVGFGLYWRFIRAREGLQGSERGSDVKRPTASTRKLLEPHVEQNLREMLQRTKPAERFTPQSMPMISREENQVSSGKDE